MKQLLRTFLGIFIATNFITVQAQTSLYKLTTSPSSGSAPFITDVSFSFENGVYDLSSGKSCTAYQLDWGDGNAPIRYETPTLGDCPSATIAKQFSHIYTRPGIYTITLLIGTGTFDTIDGFDSPDPNEDPNEYNEYLHQASVAVLDPDNAASFTINPSTGVTPFTTQASFTTTSNNCSSYDLNWGDGSSREVFNAPDSIGCDSTVTTRRFSHTYRAEGTYEASLKVGENPVNQLSVVANKTITALKDTDSLYVEKSSGNTPFGVDFKTVLNGKQSCSSSTYTMDFGDGETVTVTVPSGTCRSVPRTIRHTYENTGNFRSRLLRGNTLVKEINIEVLGHDGSCSQYSRPVCNGDENLVSLGNDARGCFKGWACSRAGDTVGFCPTFELPRCASNEKYVSMGYDNNGCLQGWTCKPATFTSTPHCSTPQKPSVQECRSRGGIFVDLGRDTNFCWKGFECQILNNDGDKIGTLGNNSNGSNTNRSTNRFSRSQQNSSNQSPDALRSSKRLTNLEKLKRFRSLSQRRSYRSQKQVRLEKRNNIYHGGRTKTQYQTKSLERPNCQKKQRTKHFP